MKQINTRPDSIKNNLIKLGIKQERYYSQKQKMEDYINKNLFRGFLETRNEFLRSGFIVRDMSEKVTVEFGEFWYRQIIECGTLCQISLFFAHQVYDTYVYSLPRSWFHPILEYIE